MQSTIEVAGLSRTFVVGRRSRRRAVEAVRDISFFVEPGERLAYIGPNGAGKSTSIKMLTGVLRPTRGLARVLGFVPWDERRELTRHIGTLFGQRSQLWFELTPRQSFRMLGAVFGLEPATLARRCSELADLLDAADLFDVPVRSLSLGQRMRCELAACMLHQPRILFLDEPTIGLDLLGKQRFRDLLVRLNEERATTIFLTSHDVADIEHVARRVMVINHGTLISDGEVASLRRTMLATKHIDVVLERPAVWEDHVGVTVLQHSDSALRIAVDTSQRSVRDVVNDLLANLAVADLSIIDPPLEQVIAKIYTTPEPPAEPAARLQP
jgi:ABC-2 type transport system ATP-binding protein